MCKFLYNFFAKNLIFSLILPFFDTKTHYFACFFAKMRYAAALDFASRACAFILNKVCDVK